MPPRTNRPQTVPCIEATAHANPIPALADALRDSSPEGGGYSTTTSDGDALLLVNTGSRMRGAGRVLQFGRATSVALASETDRGDRERLVELGLTVARAGMPKGASVICIGRRMGRVAFDRLLAAVTAGDVKEWSAIAGGERIVAIARAAS